MRHYSAEHNGKEMDSIASYDLFHLQSDCFHEVEIYKIAYQELHLTALKAPWKNHSWRRNISHAANPCSLCFRLCAPVCVHTCLHLGLIIPLYGSERLPCGSSVWLFIIWLSLLCLQTEAEREGCACL